jgi:glycosyltransferase involved in cell wall biosynthesis
MLRMTPPTTTPLRVLMSVDAVGGVWRYALDLARGLREEGVETVLAGFGPEPDRERRREAEAVAELHLMGAPLDWMVPDEAALTRVPGVLADLAARCSADVVQVNAPSQAAGLETDARVVAVCHSCVTTWFRAVRRDDPPAPWHWQRALNARGLARADRIVAPSAAHAALTRACYPGLGTVDVVPNAVTLPPGAGERRPFVHAAARWWDAGKDAATLDAAAALADWPVLASGATEGPDGSATRFRHATGLGPRPHVEVIGAARQAGVLVSTSVYEPFGLAALEAAASGAALVLSDIPTYREIWGEAALYAPPREAGAFAHALNLLAADAGFRRDMARAAADRAARFTPRAQAQAMRALYAPASEEVPA